MILDWGLRILDWETAKARLVMQIRRASIRNPKSRTQNGFTLVEMLTVIGIIVLLVSILLPVVSAVRTKGHAAKTQAILQSIAAGIQSYYGDFNAYPGPLHNSEVHNNTGSIAVKQGGPAIPHSRVTMSENLTLGLLGGFTMLPSGSWVYDYDAVGTGSISLNARNPKKFKAYMDKSNLTPFRPPGSGPGAGRDGYAFGDEVAEANDSQIAEFVDGFPDVLPILYLRAKQGAPVTGAQSVVVTNTTNYANQMQYDLGQVIGYTGTNIGVGKDRDALKDYSPPPATNANPTHGLRTADPAKSVYQNQNQRPPGDGNTYAYPYDLNAYMRHPTLAGAARQQDGYYLISAGADRIYGTKDDITFPAGR